jgi:transcriptional regulator NrdR family protein
MKCPSCQTEAKSLVKKTRRIGEDIARRRECTSCGSLFVTHECVVGKVKVRRDDPRSAPGNDLFRAWGKA